MIGIVVRVVSGGVGGVWVNRSIDDQLEVLRRPMMMMVVTK